MRFHIPTNELAGDMDAVEAFHQQVMNKASVISVSGDAIAIFRELQCLTPRYVMFIDRHFINNILLYLKAVCKF